MESIIDLLTQGRDREAQASKIYGLVIGLVCNNKDPDKLGRVKVKFPWLDDTVESWWARMSYPMAGKARGFVFIPEIDDEVLVGFEHGDVRFPYVLGCLHNAKDTPPLASDVTGGNAGSDVNKDGENNTRVIESRSGHVLAFDDTSGKEKITIVDKTGGNMIEYDTKENTITIKSAKNITIECTDTLTTKCKTWKHHSDEDSTLDVGAKLFGKSGKNIEWEAGADFKMTAKSNINGEATSAVELKAGSSATLEAGSSLTCKGADFTVKGSSAGTVDGGGTLTVKGGMVNIN